MEPSQNNESFLSYCSAFKVLDFVEHSQNDERMLSDCSLDHGRIHLWQSGSDCPSRYSTSIASVASRVLTTTREFHEMARSKLEKLFQDEKQVPFSSLLFIYHRSH